MKRGWRNNVRMFRILHRESQIEIIVDGALCI